MQCAVFRRTAIPAVLAALALLASAACSGGDGGSKGSAGANPTMATEPPRTNPTLATVPAPTTTANHYAVPAVIDAAYINKVLALLDTAVGDVVRLVVRSKTIPPEAFDRLKALYSTADTMQIVLDGFQLDIRRGFTGYAGIPGNKRSSVTHVISARPSCIFVRVERDYTEVSPNALSTPDIQWIGLKPLDSSRDPKRYNPTSWAFFYEGFPRDRTEPVDQCASSPR
jgi:hypothetical protein